MREVRSHVFAAALAAALPAIAVAATIAAAATPEERCEATKNDAAGKYGACIAKAEKALLLNGNAERYATAIGKCDSKHVKAFSKAETKAGMGVCLTEGDEPDVADFVAACVSVVAGHLGGGSLPADLTECYTDLGTCESDLTTCDDDLSTCSSDLASCLALSSNGLLTTGQTQCYSSGGGSISCTGTGQDGELQAGTEPSYVDNGDGTITDERTGLTWEKLDNDSGIHDRDTMYSWSDAFAKVATLNSSVFAGYSDWRLPNVLELESIMDLGSTYPSVRSEFSSACPASCTVLDCSCTRSGKYWTSTSYRDDPACAWALGFDVGDRTGPLKTSTLYVRAVRGGV